jgi:hypothetical protein
METTPFQSVPFEMPPEETQVTTVDFLGGLNQAQIPTPEQAQDKANKMSFALGTMSPGQDPLYESIMSGNYDAEQEKYAMIERQAKAQSRMKSIDGIINDARRNGTGLTKDQVTEIEGLSALELDEVTKNPDTYFQKKFAERTMEEAVKPFILENQPKPPTAEVESFIAKTEIAKDLAEYAQMNYEGQSLGAKAYSIASGFVPYLSTYRTHDALKDLPGSSLLKGNNLGEQVAYAYNNMSTDEFKVAFKQAIDSMDPLEAVNFSQAFVQYGASDKFVDNAWTVADVVGTAATAPFGYTARFMKNMAKASSKSGATIVDVLEASGQTKQAALKIAQKSITDAANPEVGARVGSFNELKNVLDPLFNPDKVTKNANGTSLAGEPARRIQVALQSQSERLQQAGLDTVNIARLDPSSEAAKAAFEETERLFRLQYPEANDGILAVRPISSVDNRFTNTNQLAVEIGKTNGDLFDDAVSAEATATKLYKLRHFQVVPKGDKFYLETTKAVDETSASVQKAVTIDTGNAPTPSSNINKFIGWFRPRDALVSKDINQDVKVATYGASKFNAISQGILEENLSKLKSWRSSSKEDFRSFMNYQKDWVSPDGVHGLDAVDLADFERQWMHVIKRLPTETEAQAYFTYKQVGGAEYMWNNLNLTKGKASEGMELYAFKKDGITSKVPPTIEGKMLDGMPWDTEGDAGILYWPAERGAEPQYLRRKFLNKETRDLIDDGIKTEGYRVFQLSRYGEESLRKYPQKLPEGRIHYVVARDYESTPLPLQQIPFKPGVHVEHLDGFLVSQPKIKKGSFGGQTTHDYYGDTNIFMARTEKEAKEFAEAMEVARKYRFEKNDKAAAEAFVKAKLPWSYKEFRKQFNDAGGILDPSLPIMWRAKGTTLDKQHGLSKNYVNWSDDTNPHEIEGKNVNLRYALERGLPMDSVVREGTDDNPIFNFKPARTMDAVGVLSRAVAQVTRGRILDDLKIKSANRFVAEFSQYLAPEARADAARYPMKALAEGNFQKGHPDVEGLAAARNYRRTLLEFLSIKPEENQLVDSITNKVATSVFNKLGRDRGEKVMDYLEPYMMSTIKDPSRFFRQVAFIPRMGFYNIKQLFMQGQGVVHAAAIEGLPRALNGMAAAWIMRPLSLSGRKEIIENAAQRATSYGWKKEHFLESYEGLRRSGFDHVGGEVANLDDFIEDRVVTGTIGKALDSSLYFFRAGERWNRMTAWNTAYLSWREANPLAVFNDKALSGVLERADLLALNMSRASNAGWNSGMASVPTQFWSYSARLTDQMLGGRLTGAEKMRVIGTYSAMYGVPLGVAGTTLGAFWPWHQETRKAMIDNGLDVNDDIYNAFANGLPQAAISWATGGEVNPNLAEMYGPGGLQSIHDFMNDDKSGLEVVSGAAGSTISNLFRGGYLASEALGKELWGLTTGDQSVYKMSFNDFVPLLENVSTLSQGIKGYYAYTLGEYFLKNKLDVIDDGYSKGNALFTGLMGTQPQSISDAYVKSKVVQATKDAQKHSREEAIRYIRMGTDTKLSDEDRVSYYKKANAWLESGNFTEQQRKQIVLEATGNRKSMVQRLDEQLKKSTADRFNQDIAKTKQGIQ